MDAAEMQGPEHYLSVVLRKTSDAVLITVNGELDLGSVHHLEDCLDRAVGDGDGRPIHLDMGNVSFVDCAGFAPLIRSATSPNGHVLKVSSASPRVRRLMELMGEVGVHIDEDRPDVGDIG